MEENAESIFFFGVGFLFSKYWLIWFNAGEKLIQLASDSLVTEILIHPQLSTLKQCMRNLLASFTRHRHVVHAGYSLSGTGSWILQARSAYITWHPKFVCLLFLFRFWFFSCSCSCNSALNNNNRTRDITGWNLRIQWFLGNPPRWGSSKTLPGLQSRRDNNGSTLQCCGSMDDGTSQSRTSHQINKGNSPHLLLDP